MGVEKGKKDQIVTNCFNCLFVFHLSQKIRRNNRLDEQAPKNLYVNLPVVWMFAVNKNQQKRNGDSRSLPFYSAFFSNRILTMACFCIFRSNYLSGFRSVKLRIIILALMKWSFI